MKLSKLDKEFIKQRELNIKEIAKMFKMKPDVLLGELKSTTFTKKELERAQKDFQKKLKEL